MYKEVNMGQKLKSYYDYAYQLGGLKAQMRLAIITLTSGPKAAAAPDTPEAISKFENAMSEIRKEFQ
jgi:hypothetical protein